MDFLELKQPDNFIDLDFFPVILRRPAEQAKIIAHCFGEKALLDVGVETRADVALAHLRAVLIQMSGMCAKRGGSAPRAR